MKPVKWPVFHRTRDIRYHPYFKGGISRWGWRFWTQRFTPISHWLLALTILYMVFGSNSLDFQLYAPFPYLFGIWLAAWLAAKRYRPRVRLKVRYTPHINAGQLLPIEVEIEQLRRGSLPDYAVIPFALPPGLDLEPPEGALVPPLRRGETAHARLGLRCTRRGSLQWPGFRVETDFPFGLIRAYRTYPQVCRLLVYPRFTPLARLVVPPGRRYQPGGVAFASQIGDSFEFVGNREFREGDNIRDMDWRATARLNSPIVREYREEYFMRVGVVLDTHIERRDSAEEDANFERAVSVCAAVSDYMARSDYLVDVFAAGPNLYHLTAGRSLAYLEQILDILACVQSTQQDPFVILEPEIVEHLAQITTVVCIFLDWNKTRQAFVENLRREGVGLKVILLRDSPCTLDPHDADVPLVVLSRDDFERGVEEL